MLFPSLVRERYAGYVKEERRLPGKAETMHALIDSPCQRPPTERSTSMASGQRPHILYLEDDESVLSITTSMLEHLGCHVRGETDSLKALRTFSEEPDAFNLAILETLMPQLSGLELAVRLRGIRPRFPVLFCAEYTDASCVDKIEAAGIGRVLFKPLAVNQLGGAIRQALMGEAKGATRKP